MSKSFISLDWGTSSLRATLVSADGEIKESRSVAGGVMTVKDRDFHAPLNAICEDWIDIHGCPIIASGMIGSRQGWVEAPYLACPATPAAAARAFTTLSVADKVDMHIIPGVRCGGAGFDARCNARRRDPDLGRGRRCRTTLRLAGHAQ